MSRRVLIVAVLLAGMSLAVLNAVASSLGSRPKDSTPTSEPSATQVVEVTAALTPTVQGPTPVATPAVAEAMAVQVALSRANGARLLSAPKLVRVEKGLAWQVLTERGVVFVDAQNGSVLYSGIPVEMTPTPEPSPVVGTAAPDGVMSNTVNAGASTAAPQPAPSASTSMPSYPVTPSQAAATVFTLVPGARIVAGPELVMFQGVPAYEVVLDLGVVYVDATTGAVLYDGTTVSPMPGSAPAQPAMDDDDEDDRRGHEDKDRRDRDDRHDDDEHEDHDHDEDDDD